MNRHEKPKQLNLKDAETYALASELAQLHGETLNAAVKAALREKLERDRRAASMEERLKRINALVDSYASQLGPRTMTDEEALGYDENGR